MLNENINRMNGNPLVFRTTVAGDKVHIVRHRDGTAFCGVNASWTGEGTQLSDDDVCKTCHKVYHNSKTGGTV